MSTLTFTTQQMAQLRHWLTTQGQRYVDSVMDDDFEADQESFERLMGSTFDTSGFSINDSGVRGTNDEPSSKVKKVKKAKDPNAPKRAKTPYMNWLWSDDGVAKVKASNPDMAHKEAVAEASKVWSSMDETAKEPWTKMSGDQKVEYEKAMESYEAPEGGVKREKSTAKKEVNMDDLPETPDGYDGPKTNSYLSGLAVKTKFNSLENAVAEFDAVENAGGIVFDGKYFTIRKKGSIKTSTNPDVLWIKN